MESVPRRPQGAAVGFIELHNQSDHARDRSSPAGPGRERHPQAAIEMREGASAAVQALPGPRALRPAARGSEDPLLSEEIIAVMYVAGEDHDAIRRPRT